MIRKTKGPWEQTASVLAVKDGNDAVTRTENKQLVDS